MSPLVTIGVPVYNGESTLDAVLHCLRDQSYTKLELIIIDNASNDGTEDIARRHASNDLRVKYVRKTTNHGGMNSYRELVERSSADYFLWNAADDTRSPGYIEKNLSFLLNNPEYVSSASPNCFAGEEGYPEKWITFELNGVPYARLRKLMDHEWSSHGIFYGLHRTQVLTQTVWPSKEIFALDWLINVQLLLHGPIARIPEELFVSARGGASEAEGSIRKWQYNLADFVFPFQRYSRVILNQIMLTNVLTGYEKVKLMRILLRQNWQFKLRTG